MSNFFNKRVLSPAKQTPKGDRTLKKNRFQSPADEHINSVLSATFSRSVNLDRSDSDNRTARPKSSWAASIRNLGSNFGETLEGCFHPRNEEHVQQYDIEHLNQTNSLLQQRLEAASNATNIREQQRLHSYTSSSTSAISSTALFYKNQYDNIQNQLEMITEVASKHERQLNKYQDSQFRWKEEKKLYVQRFDQLSKDLKESKSAHRFDKEKTGRHIEKLKSEKKSLKDEIQTLKKETTQQKSHIDALKREIGYLHYSLTCSEAMKSQLLKDMDQQRIELQMVDQRNVVMQQHNSMIQHHHLTLQTNASSHSHVLVHKKKLNSLLNAQSMKDSLMRIFSHQRYCSQNKLARRILGESVATHPSISFDHHSEIMSFARAQLLAEMKLLDTEMADKIVSSSPGEGVMRNIMDEIATDVLFLIHKNIFYDNLKQNGEYPNVFISADKGTDGSFVKILTWYDRSKERVEQKILDVDMSYGSSKQAADAMLVILFSKYSQ